MVGEGLVGVGWEGKIEGRLVGRVSRYHAAGQLATDRGDAYFGDLAKTEDAVPAPLMRQMLRYNLKMQLLGHLQRESETGRFRFSVGERAFATLGSKVRTPSDAALAFLCNVGREDDPTAAPLGHLVIRRSGSIHPLKGPAGSWVIDNRVAQPNTHEQKRALHRSGRPQRFYCRGHRPAELHRGASLRRPRQNSRRHR